MTYDVPDWLHDYVAWWCKRLSLHAWHVEITIARVVCDEPDTRAFCNRNTSYNHACLQFTTDIENTDYWRRVVVHELVHILLARVDHYVSDALIPQVAESSQQFAGMAYTQHMESATQHIATALYETAEREAA